MPHADLQVKSLFFPEITSWRNLSPDLVDQLVFEQLKISYGAFGANQVIILIS